MSLFRISYEFINNKIKSHEGETYKSYYIEMILYLIRLMVFISSQYK